MTENLNTDPDQTTPLAPVESPPVSEQRMVPVSTAIAAVVTVAIVLGAFLGLAAWTAGKNAGSDSPVPTPSVAAGPVIGDDEVLPGVPDTDKLAWPGGDTGTAEVEQTTVIAPASAIDPSTGYVFGNPNGSTVVTLWVDPACPYCRAFEHTYGTAFVQALANNPDLRLEYRVAGFLGEGSRRAANALACADDAGKFWEFFEVMYADEQPEGDAGFATDVLVEKLNMVGAGSAEQCVREGTYLPWVDGTSGAMRENNVPGTPWVLLNGQDAMSTMSLEEFLTALGVDPAPWIATTSTNPGGSVPSAPASASAVASASATGAVS